MKKSVFKNITPIGMLALAFVITLPGLIMAGYSQTGVKKHGWKTPITTENWPVDPAKLHLKGAPHSLIRPDAGTDCDRSQHPDPARRSLVHGLP